MTGVAQRTPGHSIRAGPTTVGEIQARLSPKPLSEAHLFTRSPTVNRLKQVALYFAT